MNRFLKALSLALFSTLLFSIVAIGEPPGDAAFKKVKLLKKRLELTDKQADSMYSVLKEHEYKRCDDVTSFTKKDECFKKVHSSKHTKMTAILTETQKAEFDDFIIECQQNHGPRGGSPKKTNTDKASCSG